MGVVILSGLFTFPLALALGVLAFYSSRRFLGSVRAQQLGLLTLLVVGAVAFPLSSSWVLRAATKIDLGLNGAAADALVADLGVPPGVASDACSRLSPVGPYLRDFDISERNFLAWMAARGWQVQRFRSSDECDRWVWLIDGKNYSVSSEVVPVREYEVGGSVRVSDGYAYFDVKNHDADRSITIIYDRTSGRAYVWN